MAMWRPPKPPRMPLRHRILGGVVAPLLVGGVAAKLWLWRKYKSMTGRGGIENSPAWSNRRSFSRLPRRKQREIIYGKRGQLRDLENITYGGGYAPRTRYARRRRRLLWG